MPQATLKRLIEATQFSMAHQDVRYYLNGMLFETEGEELRTVATDGHRPAVCSMPIGQQLPSHSVIVPRKGVMELVRLLDGGDSLLQLQIGSNNIRAHVGDFIFTSKLVDGRFPTIAASCRRTRIKRWKPAAICSSRRLRARPFSRTRNSAACGCTSARTS